MKPGSTVYVPQTRYDSKRSAAVCIDPRQGESTAEQAFLALAQMALESPDGSTLFLKEGKDNKAYFSRHDVSLDEKKWWKSLAPKEREKQQFNAHLRVTNQVDRLTRHSDPRVQAAAKRLAEVLLGTNGKPFSCVTIDTQIREDITALGQAVLDVRTERACGNPTAATFPSQNNLHLSQVLLPTNDDKATSDDETSLSDDAETDLSDSSQDDTTSSSEESEESTPGPLATSSIQTISHQTELPSCNIERLGTQDFTAADAKAMAQQLRKVPAGHAPYLAKDQDGRCIVASHVGTATDPQHIAGRANFLERVRSFALLGLKNPDQKIQETAAKLRQYVDDCVYLYRNVVVDPTLLEALDAFAGLQPPAPSVPVPSLEANPGIVLAPRITMDIYDAISKLPLNEVVTQTVDEYNISSIGSRPGPQVLGDLQGENQLVQTLIEIARFYLADTDPGVQRNAAHLLKQAERAQAEGQGIFVTPELRHALFRLAQREEDKLLAKKPIDIQQAPVDPVPSSSEASPANAIGRVLPSGLADIPAHAVQAIYSYVRNAKDGSVLTLAVDGQDLLVDSSRASSDPRKDEDRPLEASFHQVIQRLAEFYANDNDEDVRSDALQLKALTLDNETHDNVVVVTPALRKYLQTLAQFGNPERATTPAV